MGTFTTHSLGGLLERRRHYITRRRSCVCARMSSSRTLLRPSLAHHTQHHTQMAMTPKHGTSLDAERVPLAEFNVSPCQRPGQDQILSGISPLSLKTRRSDSLAVQRRTASASHTESHRHGIYGSRKSYLDARGEPTSSSRHAYVLRAKVGSKSAGTSPSSAETLVGGMRRDELIDQDTPTNALIHVR